MHRWRSSRQHANAGLAVSVARRVRVPTHCIPTTHSRPLLCPLSGSTASSRNLPCSLLLIAGQATCFALHSRLLYNMVLCPHATAPPQHTGYCPTPGCGGISVSFPTCPTGACPTGPVALDRSAGDPDLYSKTIQLTGGSAASGTGPAPGVSPGRAIVMTSSAPVSVATMAHSSVGSGASIVLPTDTLGSSHRIVLVRKNPVHQFLVLAAGASATTITLTNVPSGVLPFNTSSGSGAKTVTLQPYDTFYIRANVANSTDLTRMRLDGTQPFAVIAGATCKSFTAGGCSLSAKCMAPTAAKWHHQRIVRVQLLRARIMCCGWQPTHLPLLNLRPLPA